MCQVPLLDLDLARRITEGIVGLLSRWAPDALPWPEDRSAAEFAERLRKRDPREVLYVAELEPGPVFPEAYSEDDSTQERVLIRVETLRHRVHYAEAVFHGSLVHWRHVTAHVTGGIESAPIDPDRHWAMKLEGPEALLREMGLTPIPPAAMALRFGPWRLSELLDPHSDQLYAAGQEVLRLSDAILHAKGVRSPAQAYQRVLALLRLGYDLGTLTATLDGRA